MARDTMAALIRRLRGMVGDDDAPPVFSDDQLQDILDGYQQRSRYALLQPVPSYGPNGVTTYHEFRAPGGAWEDGAQFFNNVFGPVEPSQWNSITGLVYFDGAQLTLMRISGQTYCLNSAAADICDQWAAKLARAFDTQSNEQQMKRSQMAVSLRAQAATFRAQVPVRSVSMTRTDV